VVVSATINPDECPLIVKFAKAWRTFVKAVTVDAMRTPARKEMRWLFTDFPEIGGQCGRLAV
jgi:hypothetical protein